MFAGCAGCAAERGIAVCSGRSTSTEIRVAGENGKTWEQGVLNKMKDKWEIHASADKQTGKKTGTGCTPAVWPKLTPPGASPLKRRSSVSKK